MAVKYRKEFFDREYTIRETYGRVWRYARRYRLRIVVGIVAASTQQGRHEEESYPQASSYERGEEMLLHQNLICFHLVVIDVFRISRFFESDHPLPRWEGEVWELLFT